MPTEKLVAYHRAAPYREAGQWLRNHRRYWQITRAELAEQMGVGGADVVAAIEGGQLPLPTSLYAPVARAFSMDVREFAEICDLYYDTASGVTRSAA